MQQLSRCHHTHPLPDFQLSCSVMGFSHFFLTNEDKVIIYRNTLQYNTVHFNHHQLPPPKWPEGNQHLSKSLILFNSHILILTIKYFLFMLALRTDHPKANSNVNVRDQTHSPHSVQNYFVAEVKLMRLQQSELHKLSGWAMNNKNV